MCDTCRPPSYENTKAARPVSPTANAARVPLRELLQKRMQQTAEAADRSYRALQLLEAHPEFEAFIELQELLDQRY